MNLDSAIIDDIVARVLRQLRTSACGPSIKDASNPLVSSEKSSNGTGPSATVDHPTIVPNRVITAETIQDHANGGGTMHVEQKAIVTPAAWDAVRDRGITIVRGPVGPEAPSGVRSLADSSSTKALTTRLLIVRYTDVVARLIDDLPSGWKHERLGDPNEAATAAIGAICQGEARHVIILAEQRHRAACLANRNEQVKAVAMSDAGDIRNVKMSMQPNVWCIDPTGCSWFELRRMIEASVGR